ncbi:phosphotransferase family protein [Streptantibioticus rubrisoli]|uniref:Phosphotransferase family protein n=1 Tax=Streptantibioticus rubrisoli TaxID=1387313 RepID=A0ABT1PGJ8_9ACTN|nr:phosphotransferase family protein [Streptantibioticus rubrisoli]MCQ4044500.1 phosphotransferase family protein [Streptantibioticus rubrisoli]
MPALLQRDPELTRAVLFHWFAGRSPGWTGVDLGPIRLPASIGWCAETLHFDAEWTQHGRRRAEPLALRIAPTLERVHPTARWTRQIRLHTCLRGTGVPLPEIVAHEPTGTVLGAPFLVLRRTPGNTPSDLPSYHQHGWLAGLRPDERRTVWLGGLEVLARIHTLDQLRLGAHFLPRSDRQLDGADGQLAFYGAGADPTVRAALRWLRDNRPAPCGADHLLWGDARIGGIVYRGSTPAAVLGWEMAERGRPEADLAWYLHTDRFLSEGMGIPRLEGLPERDETVAHYEDLVGRPVKDLPYFEVLAAFRLSVLTARLARLLEESGVLPSASAAELHRNAVALLDLALSATHDAPVHSG